MESAKSFIPDASHYSGDPDWNQLAQDEQFFGAILKATEGISYSYDKWFKNQWQPLGDAGAGRDVWLRGAYHYLIFTDADDPAKQADYFMSTVESVNGGNGLSSSDIMPIVDVEQGQAGSPNYNASKTRVIDYTSRFAARIKANWGCSVMLYGHSAMVNLNITDKMNCDKLWLPTYEEEPADPTEIGWDPSDVLLWQYTDGNHNKTGYPSHAPGLTAADISVPFNVMPFDGSRDFIHKKKNKML